MRPRAGILVVVLGATFVATAACGSVPDITFDDGDGSLTGEGGTEGGVVDPNCKPTGPEICDDGIDNDCNGQIDCADSRCTTTGFGCEDAPQGWTLVSFSATQKPPCPSNENSTDLEVSSGDGTTSCTCTCTSGGGSCANGDFTVTLSSEATCSVAPSTGSVPVNNASCTALGASIAVPSTGHAKITAPTPTSCNANPSVVGGLTNGRVCQPRRVGTGCMAGQACTLRTTIGLSTCVARDGSNACPAGYPKRSTTGTNATDTRTCTGCACGSPTPCTGGSVSLYSSNSCKTNGGNQGAEGLTSTCNTTTDSGFTATHFKSTPPSGGGCSATPTTQPVAAGTLSFTGERTICCK